MLAFSEETFCTCCYSSKKIKKNSDLGRQLACNWPRIVAVILTAFYFFGSVRQVKVLVYLLNIAVSVNYNLKHTNSKKCLSADETYKIYRKIPVEYLNAVLMILNEWTRKCELKKLGLIRDVYVASGFAEKMYYKEVNIIKDKEHLVSRTISHTVFVRRLAKAVIFVMPATHEISIDTTNVKKVTHYSASCSSALQDTQNLEGVKHYGIEIVTQVRRKERSSVVIRSTD